MKIQGVQRVAEERRASCRPAASRPREAAQVTAAGAIIARSPATMPMRSARTIMSDSFKRHCRGYMQRRHRQTPSQEWPAPGSELDAGRTRRWDRGYGVPVTPQFAEVAFVLTWPEPGTRAPSRPSPSGCLLHDPVAGVGDDAFGHVARRRSASPSPSSGRTTSRRRSPAPASSACPAARKARLSIASWSKAANCAKPACIAPGSA